MKATLSFSQFKRIFGESLFLEGKHWPEDYIKTAFNTIKNSDLGKQSWCTDDYINQTLDMFVKAFGPLSHKNSNLGYFATIIRWFVAYTSSNKNKYQEFIERKLDGIIKTLLWLSNNPTEESKLKEQIKTKWTFEDFEKYQKNLEDQISREQSDKLSNVKLEDKGYDVIPINSYRELHSKFGGNRTGYRNQSEWCHTNGKSTYDSWIENGKNAFFILAKKNWQEITPPDPTTTNAYDDYGTSLIAILVDIVSGKLLNATLRWNHNIEPSKTIPGTSVDNAFLGWGDLAEVTGKDVKKEVEETLKDRREELQNKIVDANREVNEYLERNKDKIKELDTESNFQILEKFYSIVTNIKIPEGITSIGDDTFFNCSELTSVTIPNSVTEIEDRAFYNCTSLTSITIPNSVTHIGNSVFFNCPKLTSVTIGNSVTSIGRRAFYGCRGLKSITIPNNVTRIGGNAFTDCSELTSVTIGNGVTRIEDRVFCRCSSLKSIIIPNSVTEIGDFAFHGCSSLTSVTIPNSVKSIGAEVFFDCKSLTSITIPNSVTHIGSTAFYSCINLTSITLSDSMDIIPTEMFFECTNLKSITIPNSVTSIEASAFYGCSSLTSITIPESVTEIEDKAFYNCKNLKTLKILNKKLANKILKDRSRILDN